MHAREADIFRVAKSCKTDEELRTVYNYIVIEAYRRDTSSVTAFNTMGGDTFSHWRRL